MYIDMDVWSYFRFTGMGIIHTARKYIKDELVRKMRNEFLEGRKRTNINATINIREDAQVSFNSHRLSFSVTNCMNLYLRVIYSYCQRMD